MIANHQQTDSPAADDARIRELEQQLALAREEIARLEAERATLRAAYDRLLEELQLLKRRLFVAKAERVDSSQLQLEFQAVLAQVDALADTLSMARRSNCSAPRTVEWLRRSIR